MRCLLRLMDDVKVKFGTSDPCTVDRQLRSGVQSKHAQKRLEIYAVFAIEEFNSRIEKG